MLYLGNFSFHNSLKWLIALSKIVILFTISLGREGPKGNSAEFIIFSAFYFELFPKWLFTHLKISIHILSAVFLNSSPYLQKK